MHFVLMLSEYVYIHHYIELHSNCIGKYMLVSQYTKVCIVAMYVVVCLRLQQAVSIFWCAMNSVKGCSLAAAEWC